LTPFGAKIQKGTEEQQTGKEKEHEEVHKSPLKRAGYIPPFLQV
jgi:hypothetical protein